MARSDRRSVTPLATTVVEVDGVAESPLSEYQDVVVWLLDPAQDPLRLILAAGRLILRGAWSLHPLGVANEALQPPGPGPDCRRGCAVLEAPNVNRAGPEAE